MLISKNGKRLMACVMSLAMLLSGLLYIPKAASAADNVKVLGATLRLSNVEVDNNSQQSMRIGIEVPNASQRKSCQIKVSVNGKSKVISTEPVGDGVDIQYNKILSYDEDTDTVVYAIVIAGITKDDFYTNIEVTGQSADLKGDGTHISTSKSMNIMGVVNNLKNRYPNLKIGIDDNGNLVKDGGDKLLRSDLTGYDDTKPEQVTTEVLDFKSIKTLPPGAKLGDDGSIIAEGAVDGTIDIPLSRHIAVGETIKLHIAGSVGEGNDGFRCWPAFGTSAMAKDGEYISAADDKIIKEDGSFDFTKEMTIFDKNGEGNTYADIIMFKAKSYDTTLSAITIKSVSVTYLGNSDPAPTATPEPTPEPTPKPTPNPEAKDINVSLKADTAADKGPYWIHGDKNTYNGDGSVISSINQGEGTYFYFNADKSPVNLIDYDKMIITLSSDVDKTPLRLGIITDSDMNPDTNNDIIDGQYVVGTTDTTFEINVDKNKDKGYGALIALPGDWNWWGDKVAAANITIKSIELVAHKDTYQMDLNKYELANGSDADTEITYDDSTKSVHVKLGTVFKGVRFTDVPSGSEYKYAKIDYEGTVGDIYVYLFDTNDNGYKLETESPVTISCDRGITEVKLFNWLQRYDVQTDKKADLTIKSITLYNENPDA